MKENELLELAKQEEAIVYSQAIHYANRIVYLQIPMDSTKLRMVNIRNLERSNRSLAMTSDAASYDEDSVNHSSDSDVESGYMDGEENDLGQKTVRWIAKFIDKVCSESSLSTEKILHLHQMIPGVVAMHIESLEHIYRESRKLPPIHKPRMLVPVFLPGEQMLQGYLRVYLIPDGRQDTTKLTDKSYSSSFLPAEGAIFLTNYRIIFKGQPCDPYGEWCDS
ncbi:unnamed protein product [Soboliphyme baturini]|uniref:GRAM domain-containing protein n=1 Tax=Soboliphyme baturini TaxID=241478 RepID=A0A183J476_9BILA|nr:unnamed protein product [Soboliphyme baturini]